MACQQEHHRMSFQSLGLAPALLRALTEQGYTDPTPVQAQAIPVALQGRDLLAGAQTGTGKTAAFSLPLLDHLYVSRRNPAQAKTPRALVLTPTRELAAQVHESLRGYGKHLGVRATTIFGGVSFGDQEMKLDRGVDVLIATPGRLLDHFERGKLLLTGVQILVVDEADRMLDMGFIPDIERIFKLTPAKKQTLFFSATMPPEITRLTKQFLNDPLRIEVSRPATTAETIHQHVARIPTSDPKAKRTALRMLIERSDVNNGIVFCNRKSEVDIVAKSLQKHGLDAAPIHGDLDQQTRMRTLENFRKGELKLLVASDVAARGLDVPAVSHVFNYDVPHHADDYVHRIGRTGRAGRTGEAFMIVTPADAKNLDKVLKLIGKTPDETTLDADWANIKDEPRRARGDRPARGRERDRDRAPRGRSRRPEAEAELEAAQPQSEETPRPRRSRDSARPAEPAVAEAAAPAPPPRPSRERPLRPERPERPERERRGRDDGDRVVGFGDDTPAFLMRAVSPRSTDD
jgi:superfamily II DNA/RNA helicase